MILSNMFYNMHYYYSFVFREAELLYNLTFYVTWEIYLIRALWAPQPPRKGPWLWRPRCTGQRGAWRWKKSPDFSTAMPPNFLKKLSPKLTPRSIKWNYVPFDQVFSCIHRFFVAGHHKNC